MYHLTQKMEALEQTTQELTAGSNNDECQVNVYNSDPMPLKHKNVLPDVMRYILEAEDMLPFSL